VRTPEKVTSVEGEGIDRLSKIPTEKTYPQNMWESFGIKFFNPRG
jgi:hypothetical protein